MLINKEQFVKVFNENQATFHKELGDQVTGESLLVQVEKESLGQSLNIVSSYSAFYLVMVSITQPFTIKEIILQRLYDQYKHVLVKDAPTIKELDKQADEITDVLQSFGEWLNFIKLIIN